MRPRCVVTARPQTLFVALPLVEGAQTMTCSAAGSLFAFVLCVPHVVYLSVCLCCLSVCVVCLCCLCCLSVCLSVYSRVSCLVLFIPHVQACGRASEVGERYVFFAAMNDTTPTSEAQDNSSLYDLLDDAVASQLTTSALVTL